MGNQLDGARGACGRSLNRLTSVFHRGAVLGCTSIMLAVNESVIIRSIVRLLSLSEIFIHTQIVGVPVVRCVCSRLYLA